MPIRQHYADEMAALNRGLMKMGLLVEQALEKSVKAFKEKDKELAREVIEEDDVLDEMEKSLCDECALIIAREQPVAGNLRSLISVIKVVTDLERIGDHAVHIAKRALELEGEFLKPLVDIPRMAEIAGEMIKGSIEAFVAADEEQARTVAERDSEIDTLHNQVTRELLTYIMGNPGKIEDGLTLLFTSRFLERVGDHVRNICEWVVFSATGEHEDF